MNDYVHFIEELSLNAWPAYQSELYDGWYLGYSNGYSHRINSVNTLESSTQNLSEKINYCEKIYSRSNLNTIFKITPSTPILLEQELINRDYHIEHRANIMTISLKDYIPNPTDNLHNAHNTLIFDIVSDQWLDHLFLLHNYKDERMKQTYSKIIKLIHPKTIPVLVKKDETVVGCALGVLERGYIGIYHVYVDENHRQEGVGNTLITTLLNIGKTYGASHGYLQVVHNNNIAINLYHKLGFQFLYSYWFRCKNNLSETTLLQPEQIVL